MRVLIGVLVFALLSGCGLVRQKEAQDRFNVAMADVRAGVETCNQSFPKQQQTAVARARCIGDATAPIRPLVPFPDLLDQETANRNLLAERWQTGKITQAEFEAQFTQMHSQVVAEEQRRQLAGRSVNAQEAAAAAALSPTICNRVGSSTICY